MTSVFVLYNDIKELPHIVTVNDTSRGFIVRNHMQSNEAYVTLETARDAWQAWHNTDAPASDADLLQGAALAPARHPFNFCETIESYERKRCQAIS